MLDSLFGAEMPLAVRFFLAFLIVLGLIGAIAWAVRRFGSGRLGAATRGRQPRLAVIDYASVDNRRRLILVRRDNVEHLLMIGGPTDVVVEPNIVRAVAAPRDVPGARPPAGIEALPRAIPLPDNGANGSSWPLQPEPGARPSPRLEPLPDESPARPQQSAEPPPRAQRDTLAALADELGAARPAPPRRSSVFTRPQPAEPRSETKTEKIEPRAEPHSATPSAPQTAPTITPPPTAVGSDSKDSDQSLADMAQRLEAALRKPNAPSEPRRPAGGAEPAHPADTLPRGRRAGEPKSAAPEARPNESKTALYDSLEQEMASLLGRSNKT